VFGVVASDDGRGYFGLGLGLRGADLEMLHVLVGESSDLGVPRG
jgi:hypothetical protein